ncbi:MAG: PAS domain-containing protein [Campylobacterales bacterium]|nr:PAS domain-containing protein [Campylobacterales bacterium]
MQNINKKIRIIVVTSFFVSLIFVFSWLLFNKELDNSSINFIIFFQASIFGLLSYILTQKNSEDNDNIENINKEFNKANIAHVRIDKDGSLLSFNNSFKKLFDLKDENNLNLISIYTFFKLDSSNMLKEQVKNINSYENEIHNKELLATKNSKFVSNIAFFNENQTIDIFFFDKTDNKLLKEELQDWKKRYQFVAAGFLDGLWDWNIITNEIFLSKKWKETLGFDKIDKDVDFWNSFIHPDDKDGVLEQLNSCFRFRRKNFKIEYRVKNFLGDYVWIQNSAEIDYDELSNPIRMIGYFIDINEKKSEELKIKHKQKELEELNNNLKNKIKEELETNKQKDYILIQQSRQAAMGEMIGNIAHQWRQPLNALGLLLYNLQSAYEFNELDQDYLNKVVLKGKNIIQKMSSTIDDFRNFFKPNKEKESFFVKDIIDDTLILIESNFVNTQIDIKIDVKDNFELSGYPNEFSQVIANIISNSKDAILDKNIKNGKIEIIISNEGSFGSVIIKDNGGGVLPENLEKIYDPYFTTKKDSKGTGIGLYMSKMIIEDNMDGKISSINSENGLLTKILLPFRNNHDKA